MKIGLRFIALFLLLLPLAMQAQVLNVIGELREDLGNAYAVQHPVEDYNYNLCGVVFLGLIYEDVTFEGDIIKSEFSKGEWIIYMPQGSRWLNIKSNSNMFPPLHYDFPQVVQSKSVYVMTVVLGGAVPVTQQYLAFKIEPTNAVLEVDGKLWSVDADGSAMKYVDFGSYVYTVRAPDYFEETGRVTVNDPDNTKMVNVKLKPNFAKVTFEVDTDAEIWVNNEKKGIRTWTGSLGSGTYKVECRQANYETSSTSVEITADKNGQTIMLSAPRPIYGSLMVESTPNFCKLFIDGKEIGITPKSVNEIQVGQHEIRLTQEGYTDYKETVTITKSERKQVKATLDKKDEDTQPIATTPSKGQSDLTFTVGGVNFTMKLVEGGTFQMGAQNTYSRGQYFDNDAFNDESPVHSVTLSSYYMGETEVTQALWKAVMGSEPTYDGGWESKYGKDDNYPAYRVSWNDIQEFIRKLNQKTGRNFRLPTEGEWEYAARGGRKSNRYKYAGSNAIGDVAWYDENIRSKTHTVKTKLPNELGLYDMSGNVWEWCQDRYGDYSSSSQTNPTGPLTGSRRVLRGGSRIDLANGCRVSRRDYSSPGFSDIYCGFRLCLPQ